MLTDDNEALRADLALARGTERTRTWVGVDHRAKGGAAPLSCMPDRETVRFCLENDAYIEVKRADGGDVIQVYVAEGELNVLPKSSNVIEVISRRRKY